MRTAAYHRPYLQHFLTHCTQITLSWSSTSLVHRLSYGTHILIHPPRTRSAHLFLRYSKTNSCIHHQQLHDISSIRGQRPLCLFSYTDPPGSSFIFTRAFFTFSNVISFISGQGHAGQRDKILIRQACFRE